MVRMRPLSRLRFLAVLLLIVVSCAAGVDAASGTSVVAVGDMACPPTDSAYNNGAGTATRCRQRYVSDVVAAIAPDALLDLGDNQYFKGELANYQAVYDPTFGRMNS